MELKANSKFGSGGPLRNHVGNECGSCRQRKWRSLHHVELICSAPKQEVIRSAGNTRSISTIRQRWLLANRARDSNPPNCPAPGLHPNRRRGHAGNRRGSAAYDGDRPHTMVQSRQAPARRPPTSGRVPLVDAGRNWLSKIPCFGSRRGLPHPAKVRRAGQAGFFFRGELCGFDPGGVVTGKIGHIEAQDVNAVAREVSGDGACRRSSGRRSPKQRR